MVGHQVAVAVAGRAVHVNRLAAKGEHHHPAQHLARIFRQQQNAALAVAEAAEGVGVVVGAVDAEAVALARHGHERRPRRQVGLGRGADGHALLLGQADVVAPLLLHIGEKRLLALRQVEDDGARRLDGLADGEAELAQRGVVVALPVRLDFEEDGPGAFGRRVEVGQQQG